MSDRETLRGLALKLMEIANHPVMAENARLYQALNDLKPVRPVVLLDELPWNQLNGDGELTLICEGDLERSVELSMRRTLYKWNHCPGDMIVEPIYCLPRDIQIGDVGVTVDEETLAADAGNNIVAHRYHDQLPDMASLEKLHSPEITVDDEATARRADRLNTLFGDILPIRLVGVTGAGFYMPWDYLSMWRGVEPLLTDLYDDPELMHAFMRKYTGIRLDLLDRLEQMNLLDAHMPVLHCTAGLTDDLPPVKDGHTTRRNLWGRGTAQIFASVSPAMHDEFEIEYAKQFFQGFGLTYYGCCEPLHRKIDIVKKLPNVRKLSITPWADVRMSAERMGKDYVMARKPNPASVAVPVLDEALLRADILETLTVCRENGTPVEFTLKDISSVSYNPMNLTNWERVVKETILHF